MVNKLDFLDLDSESPTERLARLLAENDANLLADLVAMRDAAGLTQEELAEKLGVKQSTVSAFERYDNDPKLSTLRRYALAVGALINHSIELDRGEVVGVAGWAGSGAVRISAKQNCSTTKSGWGAASLAA